MGNFSVSVSQIPPTATNTEPPKFKLVATGEGSQTECNMLAARFATQSEGIIKAAEEVVECLMLENMQRPSFTFRRIKALAKAIEESRAI